jgi:alpha-L-fucosidase
MLREVTAGGGNLLLNIGPKPDGSVPEEATERLTKVGQWLAKYGDIVYGDVDRVEHMEWMLTGAWTRRGKTLYYWCSRPPGETLSIGGLRGKLVSARLLPDGKPLPFTQTADRLVIEHGLKECPDPIAHTAVFALQFKTVPKQVLGAGCVVVQ